MKKLLLLTLLLTLLLAGCTQTPVIIKEIAEVETRTHRVRTCDTNGNCGPWEEVPFTRVVFKDRGHIDLGYEMEDWWRPGDIVQYTGRDIILIRGAKE